MTNYPHTQNPNPLKGPARFIVIAVFAAISGAFLYFGGFLQGGNDQPENNTTENQPTNPPADDGSTVIEAATQPAERSTTDPQNIIDPPSTQPSNVITPTPTTQPHPQQPEDFDPTMLK